MGFRVEIDKANCISSGRCVSDEPAAFRFDDDELAEPTAEASELTRERLVRLARNCPGEAITVYEADGHPIPVD